MDQLPVEIVAHIFSTLDETSWLPALLTCKQWYFIGTQLFDPSVRNNVALRWACRNGQTQKVKELLKDKRVDPTDGGNAAIRLASAFGFLEIVKILLEDNRADPSSGLPLCFACMNGHEDIVVELLKDPRADPAKWNLRRMDTVTRHMYLNVLMKIFRSKEILPRKRKAENQEAPLLDFHDFPTSFDPPPKRINAGCSLGRL